MLIFCIEVGHKKTIIYIRYLGLGRVQLEPEPKPEPFIANYPSSMHWIKLYYARCYSILHMGLMQCLGLRSEDGLTWMLINVIRDVVFVQP